MNFTPFGDMVLVKPETKKETTKAGIYIPETSQDAPQQGIVVSIGGGVRDLNGNLIPMQSQKDDLVLFHKYSGTKIKLGDDEYIVMRESEILGKIV